MQCWIFHTSTTSDTTGRVISGRRPLRHCPGRAFVRQPPRPEGERLDRVQAHCTVRDAVGGCSVGLQCRFARSVVLQRLQLHGRRGHLSGEAGRAGQWAGRGPARGIGDVDLDGCGFAGNLVGTRVREVDHDPASGTGEESLTSTVTAASPPGRSGRTCSTVLSETPVRSGSAVICAVPSPAVGPGVFTSPALWSTSANPMTPVWSPEATAMR